MEQYFLQTATTLTNNELKDYTIAIWRYKKILYSSNPWGWVKVYGLNHGSDWQW